MRNFILLIYLACFPFIDVSSPVVVYDRNEKTRAIIVYEYKKKEEPLIEVIESEFVEEQKKETREIFRSLKTYSFPYQY